MALVTCEDCGSEVSTEAATCARCGRPTAPVTTQLTAKPLKLHLAISTGLIFAGLGLVLWMRFAPDHVLEKLPWTARQGMLCGQVLFSAGTAWFLATRIRIWWHHG